MKKAVQWGRVACVVCIYSTCDEVQMLLVYWARRARFNVYYSYDIMYLHQTECVKGMFSDFIQIQVQFLLIS